MSDGFTGNLLKKKARVERAKQDIKYFRETYVQGPDGSPFQGGPHHDEMDKYYRENSNTTFCSFVGSAKSSWMLGTILWEIARNRNTHLIYASHAYNVASDMMSAVQYNLQYNTELIRDFGEFRTGDEIAWRGDKFYVQGNENPRVPTMTIVGAGGRIENVRVERLYTDDVVTLDSAMSELERRRVESWFFTEFYNRLNIGGKICMIGSRFHPFDLYNTLKEQPNWVVKEFPGILDWDKKKAAWPERWPFEELVKRRETMGTAIFEARIQQNPESLYGSYFTSEMLRFIQKEDIPNIQYIVQGWDFNLSEKASSDFTVGVTMGVTEKGNWVLLRVFREHLSEQHAEHVVKEYHAATQNDWGAPVRGVFVEANLFQELIGHSVTRLDASVPLVPVKRVRDKMMRILRLQPLFEQGRFYIAKPPLISRPLQTAITSELLSFPSTGSGTHDDFPDALEICITPFLQGTAGGPVARIIGSMDELVWDPLEKTDSYDRWWSI